ncbi:hypothetical protein, partial [Cryobacterium levicorallinum]
SVRNFERFSLTIARWFVTLLFQRSNPGNYTTARDVTACRFIDRTTGRVADKEYIDICRSVPRLPRTAGGPGTINECLIDSGYP